MLKKGSKGDGVLKLQNALNERGYHLDVDGDFGARTERTVRQFQMAHGLTVDGQVGAETWAEINRPIGVDAASLSLQERKDRLRTMVKSLNLGQYVMPVGRSMRGDAHAQVMGREKEKQRLDVLLLAIEQLGLYETDRDGKRSGSNGGAQIAHIVDEGGDGFAPSAYYVFQKYDTDKMPAWCAIFICWAIKEGLHLETWRDLPFGTWQGSVWEMEQWARRSSRFVEAKDINLSNPKSFVGAAYTMGRFGSQSDLSKATTKAGHTGFVIGVEGGKLVTLDGNVRNSVKETTRDVSSISGLVLWWQ